MISTRSLFFCSSAASYSRGGSHERLGPFSDSQRTAFSTPNVPFVSTHSGSLSHIDLHIKNQSPEERMAQPWYWKVFRLAPFVKWLPAEKGAQGCVVCRPIIALLLT